MEIRQAVKVEEVTDVFEIHVVFTKQFAGLPDLETGDVLHGRESRQFAKLLAVDRLADGAPFGKVGDTEPFGVVLVDIGNGAFVGFSQREEATEDLVGASLCHGDFSVFVELCGGEEEGEQGAVIVGQFDNVFPK